MKFRDYYETLGVPRTATLDEIKGAYRKLARKYHPDVSKSKDTEERFKEVGEAYAVLKDPEKRAAYDKFGQNWKAGEEFTPPPNWDGGGFEFRSAESMGGEGADFSDFFESLFGRGGPGGGARDPRGGARRRSVDVPGDDQHAKVVIDLEDAYRGARRSLKMRMPTIDEHGHLVMRDRTLEVTIPKGIREGQHLRLAGQGGPGIGKGPTGDLFLEIAFAQDPRYRVEGRDVTSDLPLAPWEAALGTSVRLPTPDGEVQLTVPPGSRAGRKLRLKGRGIPGDPPGDLYAVVSIALPPADTDAGRDAYRAMAKAFAAFDARENLER